MIFPTSRIRSLAQAPPYGDDQVAGETVVVHPGETPPADWDASVFLGCPGPQRDEDASWRSRAARLLADHWRGSGGRLVIFCPDSKADRASWEQRSLALTDFVVLWMPGARAALPAFATGAGLDAWHDSGRLVLGAPADAPYADRLRHHADHHGLPIATSLTATVTAALAEIGTGARRAGGEREVPLPIWRTGSFQRWHGAQSAAGNTLLGAAVAWTFRVGPGRGVVFYWALRVRVHVAAEDRVKDNEVVLSRPDISVVALYRRGRSLDDTTVVLVREFRSPASTPDGSVHELPGGSGLEPATPLSQAAGEVEEETGLAVDVGRIRAHGSRQLAATMSAHHAHLFSAEITEEELSRLRAERGRPHGVAGDSERTWVEVATFHEIRTGRLVDWATLGMLTEALCDARGSSGSAPG
jgi:8-oxo-dGTP pyrophosphatase MutT (NUDIX family)